jgi:hypothetical protein
MACEFLAGEGVMFSVWGEPSTTDVDNGLLCLQTIYKKTGGPVTYVTRVPMNAPAPEPTVRQYINSKMPQITLLCATYHVVLEGTGFMSALKRGILLSLFQISHRRNTFFVHSNVDEVEYRVEPERRAAVRAVLRRAEGQGLLSGIPARTKVA